VVWVATNKPFLYLSPLPELVFLEDFHRVNCIGSFVPHLHHFPKPATPKHLQCLCEGHDHDDMTRGYKVEELG
jgi:hypothetical protein